MRVAAIYDIHGNLPALEAVLAEIRSASVDMIVIGGDVIPGPQPAETMDMVLNLRIPTRFITGNGEREVLAVRAGEATTVPEAYRETMQWVASQLRENHVQSIGKWPATVQLDLPHIGKVLFCHATPRNDSEIFTRLTPAARLIPVFESVTASVVVCGHTHMQFDRVIGDIRVVNAGSAGMPFGQSGAFWILVDTEIHFRKTVYDLKRARDQVSATDYPQASEFATRNILSVPSEAEMLELFERAAIK